MSVFEPAPTLYVQPVAALTDRDVALELETAIAASVFWRARIRALLAAITCDSDHWSSPDQTAKHPSLPSQMCCGSPEND